MYMNVPNRNIICSIPPAGPEVSSHLMAVLFELGYIYCSSSSHAEGQVTCEVHSCVYISCYCSGSSGRVNYWSKRSRTIIDKHYQLCKQMVYPLEQDSLTQAGAHYHFTWAQSESTVVWTLSSSHRLTYGPLHLT